MNEVNYELCEKCEQAMIDAGVVGLTLEEMKEQQTEFDFGMAISLLKEGERVARKGWNGKGMFIYMVQGSEVSAGMLRNEAKQHVTHTIKDDNTSININAHVDMKAADGSIVIGWLASQTDMLADDWTLA